MLKVKKYKKNNSVRPSINIKNDNFVTNSKRTLDENQLTINAKKTQRDLPKKENIESEHNNIEIYTNFTTNHKKVGNKFKIILIAILSIIVLFLIVFLPCYFLVIKKEKSSKS